MSEDMKQAVSTVLIALCFLVGFIGFIVRIVEIREDRKKLAQKNAEKMS